MTPVTIGRASVLRQALRLPGTLLAIRRIVQTDCATAALDEHLWAFKGFHLESWDPHYRARQWQKVRPGDVGPDDVKNLSVPEMAFMMHVAMEIEDPILEYSEQNGEGFRLLLPALGRFMGKSEAEAAYAKAHGLSWCESPWCAEERRHGNAFAKLIERLTGTAPARQNPNEPRAVTADENDALSHLVSRQAAEWTSSSTYVVMAAHASGPLHTFLRNLAQDEVKHLSILSAADAYLLGPRPWRRFVDLVRIGLENYRGQRRRRSGGEGIGANPISAIEVVAAHLFLERRIRAWLASVPLRALTAVFETPSTLPEMKMVTPTPEERARRDEAERHARERRLALGRWRPASRAAALTERRFDEEHADQLTADVDTRLDGFRGAEVPDSHEACAMRRRIKAVSPRQFRHALLDRLRDYQIGRNRHIRQRGLADVPDPT